MRVAIDTLGCKVNQYETQAMEQLLRERGHEIAPFSGDADVYVINSCSVTAASDHKSRQAVRRIRREHPEALVALCGCYAQTHADEAHTLKADVLSGSGDRQGFIRLLEQAWAGKQSRDPDAVRTPLESIDVSAKRKQFETLPAGGLGARTRAMLKVEDGCANFCSYCIIPYARGPVRSMPLEEAAVQASKLAAEGYREIVVTGIEISSWGRELHIGLTLIDLLETIRSAAPGVRIRLGSLEPRTITPEFCRRAAQIPELCPQFHLSLQSGCDATLKRMNRRYNTARYLESVAMLRESFRRPAITTDLITGFPGETEQEFQDTLDFIRRCDFARMHIFPYSSRPGTPAAAMPQLPKEVREARARRATAEAEQMRRAYLEGCTGEVHSVLFEQPRDGGFFGHAENYSGVLVQAGNLRNQTRSVRIAGTDGHILFGELEARR